MLACWGESLRMSYLWYQNHWESVQRACLLCLDYVTMQYSIRTCNYTYLKVESRNVAYQMFKYCIIYIYIWMAYQCSIPTASPSYAAAICSGQRPQKVKLDHWWCICAVLGRSFELALLGSEATTASCSCATRNTGSKMFKAALTNSSIWRYRSIIT